MSDNIRNEIKSHPKKLHQINKKGVLAKKVGNARRKRLNIRRMSSAGVKPPMQHFSKENICSFAKKRNFEYKWSTSSSDWPSSGGDFSGLDKKLEGVAGNMSTDLRGALKSDSTEKSKTPAEQQEEEFGGEDEGREVEESGSMSRLDCGSVSVIGRRRVMEDSLTVAPGMIAGEYEFFGAYDGHGGAYVANGCRERLHHLVEKELQEYSNNSSSSEKEASTSGVDWVKVMKACFSKMDDDVGVIDESSRALRPEVGEAEKAVGSTAVVVMVGPEELVVANCGDSRAVLCRGGVALPLSNDHKPDRPDERKRVEDAGGRIINWEGCRVQGVLATSRSIGDHYLRPYVISEPEVTVNKRTVSDKFLIIATDGLWDVMSNEVACDVVRKCLNGRIRKRFSKETGAAEAAAAILVELAIAKGSRDNISVIVVDLKKASRKASRT